MAAVCKLQTNIFSLAAVVLVVFCCLCTRATADDGADGMRPLVRAPRATRVEHDYFVHMREDVSMEEMMNFTKKLEQEATDTRNSTVRIRGFAYHAAHGFAAHLSDVAVEKVLRSSLVNFVEEDQKVIAGRFVPNWGVDRLDQDTPLIDHHYTPPCNLTGAGVDVYVMDSGIQYSHSTFGGRAKYPGCDPIDQLQSTNRSGADCGRGHGTHVAGIVGGDIVGVAPGATIFSVRVLGCDNAGSFSTIVTGAECVLNKVRERKRPSIVNLSVEGPKNFAMKRAIDNLMKNNITVVAIAGNYYKRPKDACRVSPGSIHGVITVSASSISDTAHYQSNAGVCVDLYAPGVSINSASISCDNCFTSKSGSSMAAPHVVGALALLFEQCPHMTPWRARHILLSQLVQPNKLDFTSIPKKFKSITPNLLLHTSSLNCTLQC